jgi:hypothetical protein
MKSAMSNLSGCGCSHERWARFRFSVIGPLLAAPPEWGELQEQLKSLAAKKWHHPADNGFNLALNARWGSANPKGAGSGCVETREIRSYETQHVNALWHLDFHHGSLRVLIDKGRWVYPLMLGIIDDHSRLCCHAQWYLAEGAEELCHGLWCDSLCFDCALHESSRLSQAPASWPGQ